MTLMATEKLTFQFLSPGCWVTTGWDLLLERLEDGWCVKEPGWAIASGAGSRIVKRGLVSKKAAHAWAQDWRDGKVRP
ncbi:hypothetical protein [Nonomuraea wenchangensis]|uniref:hypothetical protein n=1 Tax=Nonomuraea wenchangensis TaxID=568860 RepID=UPI00332264C2